MPPQLLYYIKLKVQYKKLDLIRQFSRHVQREIELDTPFIDQLSLHDNYFCQNYRWDSHIHEESLYYFLTSLSSEHQQYLWLIFVENYSQKDIAQLFNISPPAVCKTKKRLLQKLKQLLQKGGDCHGRCRVTHR